MILRVNYLMEEAPHGLRLNNGRKGQASIEFSLAFIIAILFLVLTCRVFVWFSGNLLRRQLAYEGTRQDAGGGPVEKELFLGIKIKTRGTPGRTDFYQTPKLDLFGKEVFKK